MATYQKIPLAGNTAAQNVFKLATALTVANSDNPQVTGWDDYNMSTAVKQTLAGSTANSFVSSVCVADTTAGATLSGWATALAQTAAGAHTNRCIGTTAYAVIGTTPPVVAGDIRTFNMAVGVSADFTPGTTGHDPVIGVRVFYTSGSTPTLSLSYNSANSETPVWVALNLQNKGTATAPAFPNTIYATGPTSTTSALDPVTKPDSGELFASQYWSQTA